MQENVTVNQPSLANFPPETESLGSIAAKNFVAGASRALGTVVVYLIFLVVMFALFSTFVWPRLEPYVTTYTEAMESLQGLQQFNQRGAPGTSNFQLDSSELQNLLNTYQGY